MLVLRRKEGQWVELVHRSGDTIRIRLCSVRQRGPGQADLAFDDPDRNFLIERPERNVGKAAPARLDVEPIGGCTSPTPVCVSVALTAAALAITPPDACHCDGPGSPCG